MQAEEAEARESVAGTEGEGRNSSRAETGAEGCAAAGGRTKSEAPRLMEAVVEKANLWQAYRRVMANKGAPGVDGLETAEFKPWLKKHWPRIRTALLDGAYMPRAVRKVDIPKPNGGVRTLGIPMPASYCTLFNPVLVR